MPLIGPVWSRALTRALLGPGLAERGPGKGGGHSGEAGIRREQGS